MVYSKDSERKVEIGTWRSLLLLLHVLSSRYDRLPVNQLSNNYEKEISLLLKVDSELLQYFLLCL